MGKERAETAWKVLYGVLAAAWLVGFFFVSEALGIDRSSPSYIFFPSIVGSALVFVFVGLLIRGLVRLVTGPEQIGGGSPRARLTPRFAKLPPALLSGRGATFSGTAAASHGKVSTFLRPEECLATFLMVGRHHDGSLFVRGVRGAGFRLEQVSGDPVLVTGNIWVVGTGAKATTREGVSALGLDPDLLIEGDGPGHTMELVVREGDELEVTGPESREPLPDLAGSVGYRDSRSATILRGTPDEPVLVRFVR